MLDPQILRDNPVSVADELKKRGFEFDTKRYIALETQRKILQTATQALQNERNTLSKAIGIAKSKAEDDTLLRAEVNALSGNLEDKVKELEQVLTNLEELALSLPNLPHSSVPYGTDEQANVAVRHWGTLPAFNFTPKTHEILGEQLHQFDFEASVKITGSRFVVIKQQLAQLHRALTQFMLDTHTVRHEYQEIYVPYIINATSLKATGQLPKLEKDLFKLQGDEQYYLAPTAEVPVTNMVRDTILNEQLLPLRYVCHSPCFRSEAGSYGRDTKGMFRQHQFEKVELVWVTTPEKSYQALETLTQHAENILQLLKLPYRVMTLCTGDMGSSAAKTYDLEVWLPGQNTYREISSCSNMEAFQARRLKARYRDVETNTIKLVHTLNGSGLAVGRTLIAVMENYQDKEGNIHIPEVLQPYMQGKTCIKR